MTADDRGVLIGMGLHMIEKTFRGPAALATDAAPTKSPPYKRMKPFDIETYSGTTTLNVVKTNNGTGYAGNGVEDVSDIRHVETRELTCRLLARRQLWWRKRRSTNRLQQY
jgi:hypothetical protein